MFVTGGSALRNNNSKEEEKKDCVNEISVSMRAGLIIIDGISNSFQSLARVYKSRPFLSMCAGIQDGVKKREREREIDRI